MKIKKKMSENEYWKSISIDVAEILTGLFYGESLEQGLKRILFNKKNLMEFLREESKKGFHSIDVQIKGSNYKGVIVNPFSRKDVEKAILESREEERKVKNMNLFERVLYKIKKIF